MPSKKNKQYSEMTVAELQQELDNLTKQAFIKTIEHHEHYVEEAVKKSIDITVAAQFGMEITAYGDWRPQHNTRPTNIQIRLEEYLKSYINETLEDALKSSDIQSLIKSSTTRVKKHFKEIITRVHEQMLYDNQRDKARKILEAAMLTDLEQDSEFKKMLQLYVEQKSGLG